MGIEGLKKQKGDPENKGDDNYRKEPQQWERRKERAAARTVATRKL